MSQPLLRIGDVADATGLTQRAIRYYEEYGLLEPASHPSGANRRYADEDLERLLLIKRLRNDVGLSLAEIRSFLEVEQLRRALRSEYAATTDPVTHLAILDRAEAVVRRRVAMFDHKLALVTALRAEDEGLLERIAVLRDEQLSSGLAAQGREDRSPSLAL